MNYYPLDTVKFKLLSSLLIYFLSLFSIHAQSNDTLEFKDKSDLVFDSLVADFNNATIDTVKVNILNEIAWEFAPTNFEKSILYSDSAQTLAKEIGWAKGEAIAIKNAGDALRYNGKVVESIIKFETCLPILQRLNDQNEVARVYNHLGLANRGLSNLEKAFEYYTKALNIYEKQNNEEGQLKGYTYLGVLFTSFEDYNKSLEYYKRAIDLAKGLEKKSAFASLNTNIGAIYSKRKEFEEALKHYEISEQIYLKLNDTHGYSVLLGHLGYLFFRQQNFAKALSYFNKVLLFRKKNGDKNGTARHLINVAKVKFSLAKVETKIITKHENERLLNDAIEDLLNSISIYNELKNKIDKLEALELLADVYHESRNLNLAYKTQIEINELEDSINIHKVNNRIANLEYQQNLAIKQKEIEVLNAENEYNELVKAVLLTFALVLIISVGYFYHQYLSIKHHSKLLEENIRIRDKSKVALKKNEQELENHKFQLEMIVNKRISKLESEVIERKLAEEHLLEAIEKVETENIENAKLKIIPKNNED